jgi:hypothetical protein
MLIANHPGLIPAARLGRWLPVAAVAILLGGCGVTGTTATLNAPDGGVANPAVVRVADPGVVTAAPENAKARENGQGLGGFGGAKKQPAQPASLLPQIGPKVAARGADEAYQLTPDELKYDCKRITGKMQVRILQVRDQRERTLTSKTAQVFQQAVVPVIGGSPHGARPDDDFKRDRSWLEAFNVRLAEKNCAAYNLETELQPRGVRDTPKPVPNADLPKAAGKTKN